MSPRQRTIAAIAGIAIGVPVLLLVLAFALVQTLPGKRMLAGFIEDLASSPDRQVRLGAISGFVPSRLVIDRLELADREGVWLVAKDVALRWSPLPLVRSHLEVDRLHAAEVEIQRRPVEGRTQKPAEDGAGSGLPRRIDIEAVEVGKLILSPQLAGETAQWRLRGSARVAGLDEDNWLNVQAQRSDGGDGFLDLKGRYEGAREVLNIKLDAREGAATVNRFSRLEGKQGIEMHADIAGPLNDLNGTLRIDAGDMLQVDGRLRAEQRDNATQATLTMTGRAGKLGAAPWLDILQGDWRLRADGSFDAASVVLRQADLQAPPGRLTGAGRIDRRDDTGDLTFTLEAASAAMAKLLPEASWQSLTAKGRLSGKLMQPVITTTLAGEGVKVGEVTIGRVNATVDGAEAADGGRNATMQAELDDIVLPTAGGRSLTTRASLSASAVQPKNQPIAVRDFKLVSPVLTAEGSGQYDPQGRPASGTLRASAGDLAVFAEALNADIAGKLDVAVQTEQQGERLALALDGTLENGKLPQVPPALLAPKLTVALRGTVGADQSWTVQSLTLQSDAGRIAASGTGQGRLGQARMEWTLNRLAALDPQLAGRSSGTVEIQETADAMILRLRGALAEARIETADVPRLDLELDARRANGETSGTLKVDGEMQKAPINGGGDFAVASDGRAVMRNFDLRWASISIKGENFAIAESGATGDLAIKAGNLQDLNPFLPQRIAGTIDATLNAVEANKVKLAATAQNFRLGNDVALDRAEVQGEVSDPLGRAAFDLAIKASGSKLAGPLRQINAKASGERAGFSFNADGTGEKLRVSAQGKAALGETDVAVDLQSLNSVYAGQTIALAGPARLRHSGGSTTVERATLRAGTGTLTAQGTIGPNSDLNVQGRSLPLSLLQALDPELQIFGVANFTGTVRGALAQPQIDVTLDANDMRLRTIRTAGIPPGALTAKAVVRNGNATIEGRFTAGQGNAVSFSGAGPLPGPDGVSEGRLRLDGNIRLAQLTPFLAGNGRLNGTLAIDLTLTANNGAIGGNGAIRIVDGRYFNAEQGIAIRDIDATFAAVGDRLEVRQFTARPRQGEIGLTGYLQIDRQLTLPVDLNIVVRSAQVLERRDMQARVSANLRLNGSVMQGMTLAGNATVERAELDIENTASRGPEIATLEVREINRPGGAPDDKRRQPRPPGPETRLSIKVNAQNVFVRGRGVDVELAGPLDVAGTISRPQVLGALNLRRGTFTGGGRRLEFTRGTVTFPDPDRLEPRIDFTATARIEDGTAEILISGSPASPKVTLTSSPPLPQDEIMAQLLFGSAKSKLNPLQLAEIAQSIGTLSGLTSSSGGILGNLRKALGFDRLGVSSDPDAKAAGSSSIGASSLEAGRYIAPGVYLGAKQGATSGSTAVVEIELTPNIKVESEVGTDARSKLGVAVEWDY